MHQEWEQRPPTRWFLAGFFKYNAPSKTPTLQTLHDNDDTDSDVSSKSKSGSKSKSSLTDPRMASVFEWVQKSGGVYRG